ncbi:MAG: hypothetical protein H7A47_06795 [Verrucomicrobiales bacterium]|nr:hypothetical protein [Verrucomicrobiales bacterium]
MDFSADYTSAATACCIDTAQPFCFGIEFSTGGRQLDQSPGPQILIRGLVEPVAFLGGDFLPEDRQPDSVPALVPEQWSEGEGFLEATGHPLRHRSQDGLEVVAELSNRHCLQGEQDVSDSTTP